jgi:hypothetical protein
VREVCSCVNRRLRPRRGPAMPHRNAEPHSGSNTSCVRDEMIRAGAQEVLTPIMQPEDVWRRSGRSDSFGAETLRAKDRRGRDLVFSPTAEEAMVELLRGDGARGWRQLPLILFQIEWKFRDEIRPRFGVMRAREFLMKDAYSFDIDETAARRGAPTPSCLKPMPARSGAWGSRQFPFARRPGRWAGSKATSSISSLEPARAPSRMIRASSPKPTPRPGVFFEPRATPMFSRCFGRERRRCAVNCHYDSHPTSNHRLGLLADALSPSLDHIVGVSNQR